MGSGPSGMCSRVMRVMTAIFQPCGNCFNCALTIPTRPYSFLVLFATNGSMRVRFAEVVSFVFLVLACENQGVQALHIKMLSLWFYSSNSD